MRSSRWFQQLMVGSVVLLNFPTLYAEVSSPADLPHELLVLRDGRHLSGRYDLAGGVLWLDGAGNARLQVAPDDVLRRTPILEVSSRKIPGVISVGQREEKINAEQQRQTIVELERQLSDVERRLTEAELYLTRLKEGMIAWAEIYHKAEEDARAHPGMGIGFETSRSFLLTKMRLRIGETRDRLARQEEAVEALTQRRVRMVNELTFARRVLDDLIRTQPAPGIVTITLAELPPEPAMTQRLQTLDAEVQRLRADNERLRELIERVLELRQTPPAPQPSESPALGADFAVLR